MGQSRVCTVLPSDPFLCRIARLVRMDVELSGFVISGQATILSDKSSQPKKEINMHRLTCCAIVKGIGKWEESSDNEQNSNRRRN